MSHIHFIFGKGGSGKSVVAPILADYHAQKNDPILCADLSQTAPTFSKHRSLTVKHYNLLEDDFHVNNSKFDPLFQDIFTFEGCSIIDNGSDAYLNLLAYMKELEAISLSHDEGKEPIFHVVLVGGSGNSGSLMILSLILNKFCVPVIVWENDFYGDALNDGKSFIELEIFKEFQHRIVGVIPLINYRTSMQAQDLSKVINEQLTLSDAIVCDKFPLAMQSRLKTMQDDFACALNAALAYNQQDFRKST